VFFGAFSINSIDFAQQLAEVEALLQGAETKITFWGTRAVTVQGFTSSFSLNKLLEKVQAAGRAHREADDLTPKERLSGIAISNSLQNFYDRTDTQVQNSNILTRILNYIREFSFFPYTQRFYIEQEFIEQKFRGYSEEKFFETFGGTPEKLEDFPSHPHSDGCFGPPSRIMAKRESIQALLHRA